VGILIRERCLLRVERADRLKQPQRIGDGCRCRCVDRAAEDALNRPSQPEQPNLHECNMQLAT
jgi:hypothetical protein